MSVQSISLDTAKLMAKALRSALVQDGCEVSHSRALEIVARQLGHTDWNTAAAALDPTVPRAKERLRLPDGWVVSGTDQSDYSVGVDTDTGLAKIRSIDPAPRSTGFATLMQSVEAQVFRGKRLRLRADIKTEQAEGAGTIWFRVDDDLRRSIRFDNMETRKSDGVLEGTTDWVNREIVLDIPQEAYSLHYGFYLRGSGNCWARSFDLSEVSADTPTTADTGTYHKSPVNLDFAEV